MKTVLRLSAKARAWEVEQNIPRTGKLADQSFASAEIRDDAAARDAFEDVFAVPCDKVTVVDDISFSFVELLDRDLGLACIVLAGYCEITHVFTDNGAQAGYPH